MKNDEKSAESPRSKTPEQALQALMARAAKAEISTGDARRLLYRWGVEPQRHQEVIDTLVRGRFIDDSRFAAAYVREKARLSRWGMYKIRAGLRAKGIAAEVAAEALAQLEEMDTGAQLEELLRRKMRTTRAKNAYELRSKLLRYGTARGFDQSEVTEVLERIVDTPADDDD